MQGGIVAWPAPALGLPPRGAPAAGPVFGADLSCTPDSAQQVHIVIPTTPGAHLQQGQPVPLQRPQQREAVPQVLHALHHQHPAG